tara:strand:+ start:1262 stop:1789 length:528 start_codon:yes stop_codon:yes gene_type:complete
MNLHKKKRFKPNQKKGTVTMKPNIVITDYLYGAYGSNLNKDQMRIRCPSANPVASYDLKGHALKFRGVADVECAAKNSAVGLGLWRITKTCEKALDRYEGFPNLYTKKFIHTHYGKVMLYVMCDQDSIYPPSDGYLNGIATGYFDFNLDNHLLKEAVTDSYLRQNNGVSLDYLRS